MSHDNEKPCFYCNLSKECTDDCVKGTNYGLRTFTEIEFEWMKAKAINRGWITFVDGKWIYSYTNNLDYLSKLDPRLRKTHNKPIKDIKWWILSRLVMLSDAVHALEYRYLPESGEYKVYYV